MENELPEICKDCPEKETCNNDIIMWDCKTEDFCINGYIKELSNENKTKILKSWNK